MLIEKKVALSIAGFDPSGGAGIQADLKVFSHLGLHGTTVVTCITSQNTKHVEKIYKLPIELIEKQIDVLFEDFEIDAVKTGMLYNGEIVEQISKKLSKYNVKPIVDPVMVATSGDNLFHDTFVESFRYHLLPRTFMITANIPEAYKFTKTKIKSIEDAKKACKKLYDLGPKYVLIKGGHLDTKDASDVLFDGKKFKVFSLPRITNKTVHGSGCTLSALIAGLIALGETPVVAVGKAKHILWNMINKSYKLGMGAHILNDIHNTYTDVPSTFLTGEHFDVWLKLKNAIEKLTRFLTADYIPEVGINIGYATSYAKKPEDICSVVGRIVKFKNKTMKIGGLDFGQSKHIASVILAAMSYDSSIRSAMNFKYSKENLRSCKEAGFNIGSFDRKNEPRDTKSTMEWGTRQVIKKTRFIPDIIYDTGDVGKEPMIRILGKNPEDIISKMQKLMEKKGVKRGKNTKCL